MKKIILIILITLALIGCRQGDNMATIGEEVNGELVTTNVTDSTDIFNNTVHQNYPNGTEYQEGTGIYQNTGDDIVVPAYAAEDTYTLNQIVFKDSLVKKVIGVEGDFPKQPEDYTNTDTSFDDDDWQYRYMKFKTIPSEGSLLGVKISSSGMGNKGIFFKSDGTKMYSVGTTEGGDIYQATLDPAWDLSSADYDEVSVSTQSYAPSDVFFKPDGTKMYEVDVASDKIYQYTLDTPWDLSSADYDSVSIATQGGGTTGIFFKSDGTKMYEIDFGNDKIYQSTLNPAWDLSSADYDEVSVSTQSSEPHGVVFNTDGTKMYEVDVSSDKIYQYTLDTPWDLSSADYDEVSVSTQGGYPAGISFNSDGTKMYETNVGGAEGSYYYEYVLGTAWDVSTAFYSVFPAYHEETRDSVDYTYKIEEDGGDYTFTSTKDEISDNYTPMTYHTHLDDTSLEPKAYIGTNGTWLAKTLIVRPTGVYIRTSIDAAIEYETLTDYQFSTVDFISNVVGFNYIRYTNPYRPFDGTNITPAIFTSPMTYTVKGLEEFNSFTLAKVLASSITYSFTLPSGDDNYALWLDGAEVGSGGNGIVKVNTASINCDRDGDGVLSKYPTTVAFYADYQMPTDSTVEISLTHDENISLGDFTLNNSITGGFTNLDFTHGIQDFNDYTPDAWGNIPESVKAIVTKFNVTVDIYLENYDHCVSFNESIAGKFVTIDASDSGGEATDSLTIFASLIRRVRVTGVTAKTVVKDGELYRMAGVSLAVQEIV